MRELNKYKKKQLWKVKCQVEVLAFGAYVFESYQSLKQFMTNMYLYLFSCPFSNDCSLVTYANGKGSAVLTY